MFGPNPSATGIDIGFRPVERLLLRRISGPFMFTTSLGREDQVLLHLIVASGIAADVVTLDTARSFPEAYELWGPTERRYGLRIREPLWPCAEPRRCPDHWSARRSIRRPQPHAVRRLRPGARSA
jgi:3'-phosphoadenosine 5'-phosphosulfate sulfotransferase (PAPS reductase)/FAD synthetase